MSDTAFHQPASRHEPGDGPRIGSLCTGYGGLDLAVEHVLGGRLVWYAETDPHARTVLAARWPAVANLGDIRTINWSSIEPVDVLTAGFPCQDISNAGKRAGITGEHSILWAAVADAVRALHPPIVFVEFSGRRSSVGGSTGSTPTWPRSGTTRGGNAYARPTSAPPNRRDRLFLLYLDNLRAWWWISHW